MLFTDESRRSPAGNLETGRTEIRGRTMKSKGNLVVKYASGGVGKQLIAKTWKGRPYLASYPYYPDDRKFSEKQLDHQMRFRRATSYAKGTIDQKLVPEAYERIADRKRLTVYNVAIKDFFSPPDIFSIGMEEYTGKKGEEIVVEALDDVEVTSVHIVLRRDDEIIEEGDAVQDKYNVAAWRYKTQKENGVEGTVVEAYAKDLPGNVTKGEVEI